MANDILLGCRELRRVFLRRTDPPLLAVDDVSLAIGCGEFVVVAGRSGAGKTTLLNLLGGLDRPTSGTVLLDGVALEGMSDAELARVRRTRIGFVFQDFNLLPGCTAFENIDIALAPTRLGRKERNNKVEDLLVTFDLQDHALHLPSELSVGQKQRVAIARALVNRPSLILADEPTGGVDPITAKEVVDRLVALNRTQGVTVVVATHGAFPTDCASRVCSMDQGRLFEVTA